MNGADRPRILVVEDDADTRANLRDILELDEYRVDEAGTAAEALARPDWRDYAAIVLDRRLPDGTAVEVLPALRRAAPGADVVVVTGYADLEGAIEALRAGATDYILKPLNVDALRASLGRVVERQRLRREKERSEAAFRQLVESADCIIAIARPDRRLVYLSPFGERLIGYGTDELRGRDAVARLVPRSHRRGVMRRAGAVLAGAPVRGFEAPVRRRDGATDPILWNARRLEDYEGGPAILAVGQDISPIKRAQEDALRAQRLAAIGEMVAGLAHESRNALQRSQACLERLGWAVADRPEAQELIGRLQRAQDDLARLYEDVRSYAAPILLARAPCDLAAVWREAWEQLAPARRGRDAALREAGAARGLVLDADAFRLRQVFTNLFDNALAACADPVTITVRAEPATLEGRPAVRVSVRDDGPGFEPRGRERLFEPFFTTKTKGTGLGLAIARRIVEAHGGRIGLGEGPGAEVVLQLPRSLP